MLLLEVREFQGEQGLIGLGAMAPAMPVRSLHQVGGSLLHGVENEAGMFGVDAFVGESADHLEERNLHGVHVLGEGHVQWLFGAEGAGTSHVEAASADIKVKVAVIAALQGR